MERLFTTNDVHPRDRYEYWHDIACTSIVYHDSTTDHRRDFSADIEIGNLGNIEVVLFRNGQLDVTHGATHIARSRDDQVYLCQQLEGEIHIEQDSRDCLLGAGAFTLLDPNLPYAANYPRPSRMLICKLPRKLLESRLGQTREFLARRPMPVNGDYALLTSFLSMLPDHVGKISAAAEEQIEHQLADLMGLVLSSTSEGRQRGTNSRAILRLRIRAAIAADLHNPTLDARTVAERVGISLRYANALIADENLSVGRLILERRLERCRAALLDPIQAGRSISDIAFGWGFSDMTHFGRCFKKAYGMLPRDYRKTNSVG
jgi:AraC-like DNA-binding protein